MAESDRETAVATVEKSGPGAQTPGMTTPGSVVRAYAEAWLAGDIATVLDLYADDIVLHYGGTNPLTGDHRGKHAAITVLLAVQEKTQRVPTEVIDVMEGTTYAAAWVREEWTVDGDTVELMRLLTYRVAGGKLAECWLFDHDQALVDRVFSS